MCIGNCHRRCIQTDILGNQRIFRTGTVLLFRWTVSLKLHDVLPRSVLRFFSARYNNPGQQ